MFKRILLLVTFAAAVIAGSFAMPQKAEAWRGYGWGRPYVARSYYYGGPAYYARPYRSYYRSYYAPSYYYGPRYYSYPAYTTYYGGGYAYDPYYYPRSGVTFSVGF